MIEQLREADLVTLAAAGEHDAFDLLFGRYHQFVERSARSLCRRYALDSSFAPDVAQETWLSLLNGEWRLDPGGDRDTIHNFITAVMRILVWRFKDANHPTIRFVPFDLPIVTALAAIHHDPVLRIIDAEQTALLRWAVAGLPQDDRALLRLRYADGLTCRAIASRRGRAMQTVAERLARIHLRIADACGVTPMLVRKGRHHRDVAFRHDPYGPRTPRAREQAQRQEAGA